MILAGDQSTYLSFRITNGGKSTLSQSLHQQIPNSCIIAQDSYFKVYCEGFFGLHWWLSCYTVLQRDHTMMLFFSRKTLWYLWTAADLSSMTVSTQNVLINLWHGCTFVGKQKTSGCLLFVFRSAWCSPHGHDDEPRWLVAKQSWIIPEGAWFEHGACSRA